jgi:hypothetical protein
MDARLDLDALRGQIGARGGVRGRKWPMPARRLRLTVALPSRPTPKPARIV